MENGSLSEKLRENSGLSCVGDEQIPPMTSVHHSLKPTKHGPVLWHLTLRQPITAIPQIQQPITELVVVLQPISVILCRLMALGIQSMYMYICSYYLAFLLQYYFVEYKNASLMPSFCLLSFSYCLACFIDRLFSKNYHILSLSISHFNDPGR